MKLLTINKTVDPSGHTMNVFHSHNYYEIYILTKGERSLFLDNALYHVTAPSVVVISPQIMHRTEGDAYERYNILLYPEYLGEYERKILEESALKIYAPTKENFKFIVRLTQELEKLDNAKNSEFEYIAKSLFTSLVYVLSLLNKDGEIPKSSKNLSYLSLKLVDYMNTHYGEEITLDFLADKFFVSKSTIIYTFKKDLKCTPISFLLNLRLNNAKKLLITTSKPVAEISKICGFSSPNYFGDMFKAKEKLTPIQYRKLRRQLP